MSASKAIARALSVVMSDLSERFYCASWMEAVEYDLWAEIQPEPPPYRTGYCLTDEDRETLRGLADACGGWIGPDGWLPMDEWTALYAEWLVAHGRTTDA